MRSQKTVACTKSGLVSLVFLILTACGTMRAPAPTEAEYRGQYTRAVHADALISEGRFNEALQVVIEAEEMLWLEKDNAEQLFEFIEQNPESAQVQQLNSMFDTPASFNKETWEEARRGLAQGQALIKLTERADTARSRWVAGFTRDYDKYQNYWLSNIPEVLTLCGRPELASCLENYPLDVSKLSGRDRQAIISSVAENFDLGDVAIPSFARYLEITDDLFPVFFQTGRQDLPIVRLVWISVGEFPDESQIPSVTEAFARSDRLDYQDFQLPDDRFSLFGVVISDRSKIKRRQNEIIESEYISSRQSRPNPKYQRLQMELEQAQFEARQAQQALSNAQGAFSVGFYRGQAAGAQAKANRLFQQLRGTQSTIVEEIRSPYTYSNKRYEIERSIGWRIYLIDRQLDQVWATDVSHDQLTDFSISHGVNPSDVGGTSGIDPNDAVERVYDSSVEISLAKIFAVNGEFSQVRENDFATDVERTLDGIKKDDFVYLAASDFQAQNPVSPTQNSNLSMRSRSQLGGEFWLRDRSDNGSILTLSDGSVWQVDAMDRVYTMLWLPTTQIMVVESEFGDLLVNTDDGEKARAVFLGYR